MLRRIYDLLPAAAKHRLKSVISTTGHRASWLDAVKARDHAASKKRLDLVARQMAEKFRPAGVRSFAGAACLEFGAGYTPSELLVYHLLGGAPLWAADYNSIARLGALHRSLHCSDRNATIDALSGFADRAVLEKRFADLARLSAREFDHFVNREVTYVAPFDAASHALPRAFDWINSTSVLEHISPDLMRPVLRTLADALAPGGMMMHHVDLKDHWDLHHDPLRFLREGEPFDEQRDADARGNGWRKSDYRACFDSLPDLETRIVFELHVSPSLLPATLKARYRACSSDELLGGEIVLVSMKKGAAAGRGVGETQA